jgi:ATP-dependent Clp protease, protease subunit
MIPMFASPRAAALLACAALSMPWAAAPVHAQQPAQQPGPGAPPGGGVDRVYVLFKAPVTEASVNELVDALLKIARSGVPEVDLLISTTGGEVAEAVTAYYVLRSQPFRLVTYNVGQVASAGVVLFLAGSERYAAPHASFSFHEPDLEPDGRLDEAEAAAILERLRDARARLSGIIADATGLAPAAVDGLLRDGATLDADAALARHLVRAVREPVVPANNPIRTEIH